MKQRRLILLLALLACGCEDSMRDQARIKPLDASPFFADGRSARPLPPHIVSRGTLHDDSEFQTGRSGESFAGIPMKVTKEVLRRGRERFTIFCALCHGDDGSGNGTIVQRGFAAPPSYHSERLRGVADGYIFEVITHGKGAMYPHGDRVPATDRWAIVAYIRALQLSRHAALEDVPEIERSKLEVPR